MTELKDIDLISQQGMAARGLSSGTTGISSSTISRSTRPNIDWSNPEEVNKLYHGDYSIILRDDTSEKPEPKKLTPKLKTAGLNFRSVKDVQTWLTNNGFDTKGIDNMYGANTKAAIDKLLNNSNFGLTEEEKLKFRDFQNSATFYRAKIKNQSPTTPKFQSRRTSEVISSALLNVTTSPFGLSIKPITLDLNMSTTSVNPVNTNTEITQPETSNISNNNFVGAEHYYNEDTMRHAFNEIFNSQVNGKYTLHGNLIDDIGIQRDPNYLNAWKIFKELYDNTGSWFGNSYIRKDISNEKKKNEEKRLRWLTKNPKPKLGDYRRNEWYNRYHYYTLNGFPEIKKQGGTINKYKQGNKMNNEQKLQKAFMAYLIEDAAAQGVQIQSEQDLQAYAQKLGEEGLKVKYQEFMLKMQGQSVKAALGAKLNYIRKIKGMCPDGEETYFFKEGGSIKSGCKPCMAKAQKGQELKTKGNAIQDFKNKRKHINESDTVHTKYGIRDLNGNTKYPKWNPKKENYTTQERQRVIEKDWDSGKKIKVEACGGKAKKKK